MPFYFRLPSYGDLNSEQRSLLLEPDPLAIGGGPGTGKSVVALWRHIMNYRNETNKSLLLTYTKSLEHYLRASAATENEEAAENVSRIYWWIEHKAKAGTMMYDEIIVDEAQDVGLDKHKTLKNCCRMLTYSADDNQMLYPDQGVSKSKLEKLYATNYGETLEKNYRNTKRVSRLIKSLFKDYLIQEGEEEGIMPNLICSNNNHPLQQQIAIDIIKRFRSDTHNIVILHPTTSLVNMWYKILLQNRVPCSKYVNTDAELVEIDNVHICTYKSAKGLEFDTVIMPDMNCYHYNMTNLYVVEDNDYYVAFTRARRNLFLLENGALVNGRVQNDFLKNAIDHNLVKIDLSYVQEPMLEEKASSRAAVNNDDDDDDLPF